MHFLASTPALPLFLISSIASLPFFDLPAESLAEALLQPEVQRLECSWFSAPFFDSHLGWGWERRGRVQLFHPSQGSSLLDRQDNFMAIGNTGQTYSGWLLTPTRYYLSLLTSDEMPHIQWIIKNMASHLQKQIPTVPLSFWSNKSPMALEKNITCGLSPILYLPFKTNTYFGPW